MRPFVENSIQKIFTTIHLVLMLLVLSGTSSARITPYDTIGDYKTALAEYKRFAAFKDSMSNVEQSREVARLKLKNELDKKKAIEEAENKKETALATERKKRQELFSYIAVLGLLLVGGFAIVLYGRLKLAREQKKIIQRQKHIVDEKQKEILDSIYYARRIQKALLTSERYIEKNLN
jgi:hypothetical protein